MTEKFGIHPSGAPERKQEMSETRRALHELEATGQYLFHGSPVSDIEEMEPRQAFDWSSGMKEKDGDPCVATTPFADVAIFRSIVNEDWTSFEKNDDGSLSFKASEKALESSKKGSGYVYVFKKDAFKPHQDPQGMEWRAHSPQKPTQFIHVSFRDLPENIHVYTNEEISALEQEQKGME